MNSPAPSLGQGWQVKLTSRSTDEHSATLPVTATMWTVATEHLLWTTYSLSNSTAVSKAMMCYWSFLYVLHNALEIAQRKGEAFEPSRGKIPWLPEKGYFADGVKYSYFCEGHQLLILWVRGWHSSLLPWYMFPERFYLKFCWWLNGIDSPMFISKRRRKKFNLGNKYRCLSLVMAPHTGHIDGLSAISV